ncbi:hypothetical protein WA026_020442, partial [Henosepilachna vigintioctopunctata]
LSAPDNCIDSEDFIGSNIYEHQTLSSNMNIKVRLLCFVNYPEWTAFEKNGSNMYESVTLSE